MSDSKDSIAAVAETIDIALWKAEAAAALLDEGATVPFVARYRKEATGGLDEVALITLRDALNVRRELEKRRKAVLESLVERDLLTPDLKQALEEAATRTELEDLYLPYRPRRRTRADAAKEAGYAPLAEAIFKRQDERPDTSMFADAEAALAGARDILAERFNEDSNLRSSLRLMTSEEGLLSSKVVTKKKEEDGAAVYRDYFDFEEAVARVPSHRILAVLRGGKEGYLRVKARVREVRAVEWLERRLIRGRGENANHVKLAIKDAWNRLTAPSLETDVLKELKARADEEAVRVFAKNLKTMLLASPLGRKSLVAVDPGFRTGGKAVALDAQGVLKGHDVIHPEGSSGAKNAAKHILKELADRVETQIFAVGNGTAGRETEDFIRETFPKATVVSVDERGASIYSASEAAREEFGDLDLTVRGAISIGRRLQDPLAELVKINPAAIGVGQYQHDVEAALLSSALDDTVLSAVNAVGVELNTASAALLSRVSGLGPKRARAVVNHREKNGPFGRRRELLDVAGLGAKAFEQAAGFLRIAGAANPLDASAVHPERYTLVKKMAADMDSSIEELLKSEDLRKKVKLENYVSKAQTKTSRTASESLTAVGLPTLKDIMAELAKPGRDPRGTFEAFSFDERIRSISDVEEGMILPGIVTNVTAFGAFVDVGAHQDGLVHISQMADRYVKDPSDIVSVGDKVRVKVLEVDTKRKRMGLSMKDFP